MFLPFFGFAGQYPIITSLSVSYHGNVGATYYIKQSLIEIGSAADVVLPANYWVTLGHKHTEDGVRYVVAGAGGGGRESDGIQTIGQLAKEVYDVDSGVTTIDHEGPNGFKECVAYAAIPIGNDLWDTALKPGGCMDVPPADEWCKITTPQLVLEHGNISLQNAEGSIAKENMGIQCTAEMTVTFNLVTQDKYIYLDEGRSEVTVDGKSLNTAITLEPGNSELLVQDLLTGITTEGFHTGSSVLVMMPY